MLSTMRQTPQCLPRFSSRQEANTQVSLQRPGAWGPAQLPRQTARARLVGLLCAWPQAPAGVLVREARSGSATGEGARGLRSSPRVWSHMDISRSVSSFSIWRKRPLISALILTWVQRHIRGRAQPLGGGLPCSQSRKNVFPRQVQGGLWALGMQGCRPREEVLLTL